MKTLFKLGKVKASLTTLILLLVLFSASGCDLFKTSEELDVDEKSEVKSEIDLTTEKSLEIGAKIEEEDIQDIVIENEFGNEITEDSLKEFYPEETFFKDETMGTYQGRVIVRGYAQVEKMPASFCDPETDDGCMDSDYVFFYLLKNENPVLKEYLNEMSGNSFLKQNALGLGCKDKELGVLVFYNDSEDQGMNFYQIGEEDSNNLFSSSMENPITIALEKLPLYSGMGAPDCYSHFTYIIVF